MKPTRYIPVCRFAVKFNDYTFNRSQPRRWRTKDLILSSLDIELENINDARRRLTENVIHRPDL